MILILLMPLITAFICYMLRSARLIGYVSFAGTVALASAYYDNFEEFAGTVREIETNASLRRALGRQGRDYFRAHYDWPVIERKYLDMLARLADDDRAGRPGPGMTPLPGWFDRRRRDLPPARDILAALPSGAVVPRRQHPRSPSERPLA